MNFEQIFFFESEMMRRTLYDYWYYSRDSVFSAKLTMKATPLETVAFLMYSKQQNLKRPCSSIFNCLFFDNILVEVSVWIAIPEYNYAERYYYFLAISL